jgi:BirA family transcriptional regulator, biotin operon repressor / biotin---[acetyl-CoA-carboxylase] ligase
VIAVTGLIGGAVHALDTVDSTQTVLAGLARQGAPEGTVVTARHQTGGRGRRGRHWWDAPGQSLLVSVLLRPAIVPGPVSQIALAAGVAVADALENTAGVIPGIRWPNDVLVDGRKIGGVLAETAVGADGAVGHVLLGIGINVDQSEFPAEVADRAISLRLATGLTHDHGQLLKALLEALDRGYRAWLTGGFAPLRDEWRRRASTLGERVHTPDGEDGVAVDVAADGALLVDVGRGPLRRVVSAAAATEP